MYNKHFFNLLILKKKLINLDIINLYFTKLQVLHGCRQSVLSKVRLTPPTDEIPTVNFYLTHNC